MFKEIDRESTCLGWRGKKDRWAACYDLVLGGQGF